MNDRDPAIQVSSPRPFELYSGGPAPRVRRIEHELFGSFLAPEGPSDLADVLAGVTRASSTAGWRGQAAIAWRIDSALARRVRLHRDQLGGIGRGDHGVSTQMREVELRLLSRARLAGHDQRNGRTLSDLELSAVLQHHGAATRLLDCTANAYVALWFACRGGDDKYGLLAAFDLSHAWHIRTTEQLRLPMADLLSQTSGTFCAWRPSALSPRIAAQQGLFVFSDAVEAHWGSVRFSGDTLGQTGAIPGLNLFGISPDLKGAMRSVWAEMFGYTEESLFPDLDGFARIHGALDPFPTDFDLANPPITP